MASLLLDVSFPPAVASTGLPNLLPCPCGRAGPSLCLATRCRHQCDLRCPLPVPCGRGCSPGAPPHRQPGMHGPMLGGLGAPSVPGDSAQLGGGGLFMGKGGRWVPERWGGGLSAPHLGGPPKRRATVPCSGCRDEIPSGCSQGQGGDAAQAPWGTICSSAAWWGRPEPLPAAVGVLPPPLLQPPRPCHTLLGGIGWAQGSWAGGTVSCVLAPQHSLGQDLQHHLPAAACRELGRGVDSGA